VSEPTVPEPWLRGILPDLDPAIAHLIRAAQQIREDIEQALAPLTPDKLWATPHGMTSAGFHAKHLAGSTQRLCAYLEGRALTGDELAAIHKERTGHETAAELIRLVDRALHRCETQLRSLKPEDFGTLRYIGRARLPVTAIGLAIHIAEHGQRHTGQAISAAKLAMKR
jgi:hypothetical protein